MDQSHLREVGKVDYALEKRRMTSHRPFRPSFGHPLRWWRETCYFCRKCPRECWAFASPAEWWFRCMTELLILSQLCKGGKKFNNELEDPLSNFVVELITLQYYMSMRRTHMPMPCKHGVRKHTWRFITPACLRFTSWPRCTVGRTKILTLCQ